MTNVVGTLAVDDFQGSSDADRFWALAGDDVLRGGDGDDLLFGMGGSDVIYGGNGNDYLVGGANYDGRSGSDSVYGGDGDDRVSGHVSGNSLRNSFRDGMPDASFNVLQLNGESGNDNITGTIDVSYFNKSKVAEESYLVEHNVAFLTGGDGNDDLHGALYVKGVGSANATIRDNFIVANGGEGNDRISVKIFSEVKNPGNGVTRIEDNEVALLGGKGDDRLMVQTDVFGANIITIFGGQGTDTAKIVYTGDQDITLDFSNGYNVDAYNLVVTGIERLEFVSSGGADSITGGSGSDRIDGGSGDDKIFGGFGNDILSGGKGKDTLTGGSGADVFRFGEGDSLAGGGARDTITDFKAGIDKIDISWLGITAFEQLSFKQIGSGLVVYADQDMDGFDYADFGVQLAGIKSLSAGDFIFG